MLKNYPATVIFVVLRWLKLQIFRGTYLLSFKKVVTDAGQFVPDINIYAIT
jgi:hypothetical protein